MHIRSSNTQIDHHLILVQRTRPDYPGCWSKVSDGFRVEMTH